MAGPDLKVWLSVHWCHGNTELNCIYVGKSMPTELSHSAQSSSYGSFEHLLFQSTSFPFHQASSVLPAAGVCFSHTALRQKQRQSHIQAIRLVTSEERENALCQDQTQKTGLGYVCSLERLIQTKKRGCRIIINLYSYFHSLTLNSLIPLHISTGFSVSLFAHLEILPIACVKSEGAGFGHMEITCYSQQSRIEVHGVKSDQLPLLSPTLS